MKLKNKRTGEIGTLSAGAGTKYMILDENGVALSGYTYLRDLFLEWHDYEEPKVHWYIGWNTGLRHDEYASADQIEIGNYFKTKEEAERAVEKLRAWKRLRNRGFRFEEWGERTKDYKIMITAILPMGLLEDNMQACEDLDLLFNDNFGGEE